MSVEHTLAMIKPEGMRSEKKILSLLIKDGFIILAQRLVHLNPEQVSDFYQSQYGHRDFPLLVASTSIAPVKAVLLGRPRAIKKLKEVVGPADVTIAKHVSPKSLNSCFGNFECNLPAVHASNNIMDARKEIVFFFPHSLVEPVNSIKENLAYIEREIRPHLKEGLAQAMKEKPVKPKLWLADWLLENRPNQPLTHERFRRDHI